VNEQAQDDPSATLEGIEERLDAIESALARLEEGTYRKCTSCGGRIDSSLLDADPARRTCGSCGGPIAPAGPSSHAGG
jgi:RNA polymerase-binding transcription factor DksA